MSDPLMQTFCCNPTSSFISILPHFNSVLYNIICLLSSLAGILGATYQLLPRRETWLSQLWFSLTSLRGRQIILWLALVDLLASLGVFLRASTKLIESPNPGEVDTAYSMVYCTILVVWTQYFYSVTWCWTLCYAFDTWLAVQRRPSYPWLYHLVSWLFPGLFQAAVYLSSWGQCPRQERWQLVSYGLVGAVMVLCPFFYWLTVRHLKFLAINSLGQLTNKERSVVRSACIRFGLIVLAFYLCWLPNLIHGLLFYIWSSQSSHQLIVILWYLMAVFNPLQALFNCGVYRRPKLQLIIPFKLEEDVNEISPLLQVNINA